MITHHMKTSVPVVSRKPPVISRKPLVGDSKAFHMAHVAAVASAAVTPAPPPSVVMPTEVPLVWAGRLEMGADVPTTARKIDDLVAGETGIMRATGSFAYG